MLISRAEAATILEPFAAHLVDVCRGGWQLYCDEGIPRSNPTTRANIVNDHMHAEMRELLPDASPTAAPRGDKPMYKLGALTVRLKLLKNDKPANVSTGAQTKIARQVALNTSDLDQARQLVLDGLEADPPPPPPSPPYITVGPQLDRAGAEVTDVRATMWLGNGKLWSISLLDLAASGQPPIDIAPLHPVAPGGPSLPGIAAKAEPAASAGPMPAAVAPLTASPAAARPRRARKAVSEE